ncbi:MAG: DUF4112 domain-containing protein [Phaeodactylibacter sp.]|uniref:DUF4112 domain-containing protein n=1 Tax=Phaeodactylibacter sp. TaxID=1940289 RepID=UPI0032ECC84D
MTHPSPSPTPYEDLKWLDTVSDLLDTRYRIPGTNVRFGADFLVGLIPGAGDAITFGISAILVLVMARKGASGMVLFKMIGNIVLDVVVGTIPLFGDLFDLGYKANRRNLHLLEEHYREGRHQGSAWGPVMLVALVLLGLLAFSVYVIWRIFSELIQLFF